MNNFAKQAFRRAAAAIKSNRTFSNVFKANFSVPAKASKRLPAYGF